MSNALLEILQTRRDELARIDAVKSGWSPVSEWHARTRPIIAKYFAQQVEPFDQLGTPNWSTPSIRTLDGQPLDGINHSAINDRIAGEHHRKLLGHIDALIELLTIEEFAAHGLPHPSVCNGNGIFLVHGHSERWLHEVARFIENLGLEVTVLREEPNEGKTIIEKFETYASKVGFAVVLLTADDRGGPLKSDVSGYRPRARQNVIMELGFFLARLGRSKVCALYADGVEIPSDYSGVLFVPIEESGAWKLPLTRELQAARLPIDLSGIV